MLTGAVSLCLCLLRLFSLLLFSFLFVPAFPCLAEPLATACFQSYSLDSPSSLETMAFSSIRASPFRLVRLCALRHCP